MSTIKVDTYQTRGGASEIAIDKLKGVTAAGSMLVVGEGGTNTTNLQQGLAKGWYHLDNDYTGENPNSNQTNGVTIQDSFNVSGILDVKQGSHTMSWANDFNSGLYSITQQGQYVTHNITAEYGFQCGIAATPAAGSYTFTWVYYNAGFYDPAKFWASAHGDLA